MGPWLLRLALAGLVVSGFLWLTTPSGTRDSEPIELTLSEAQLAWVGEKIFNNECAGREACLVHWNRGEAFPSLGIGHFIWYPTGIDGRFTESFPKLIRYLLQRGASVPEWLRALEPLDAPWPNRQVFLNSEGTDPRIAGLRRFLASHQGLQAEFMFRRARASLDKVVAAAREPGLISRRLRHLASTPGGVYALVDYVNFKGEGLTATETYHGEGWGLLQVLQKMPADLRSGDALAAFREAAGAVLSRRAALAENSIEREQWLPGWLKRIESYQEPVGLGSP